MNIMADKPELGNIADRLETQLNDFASAVRRTDSCAQNLGVMWEGESHDTFMKQHDTYMTMFNSLMASTRDLIDTLRTAQAKYSEVDDTCARLLRNL